MQATKEYFVKEVTFKGEQRTAYLRRDDPTVDPLYAWTRALCKAQFDASFKRGLDATAVWIKLSDWRISQQSVSPRHNEWAEHCFHTALQVWDSGYVPPTIDLLGA